MQKWFKFFSADYLIDGKIRSLSPAERSCLITLLCLADTSEIPGEIYHLTEKDLLRMAGLDPSREEWDETEGVLAKMEQINVLKRNDNGSITMVNFRKRQGKALNTYERVKKHRLDSEVVCNESVTDCNEIGVTKKRIEENRNNNIYINKQKLKNAKDLLREKWSLKK